MKKFSQDLKCFVGAHKYEIHAELPMEDVRGNTIGKVIVTKCSNCGKIKQTKVHTMYAL